MSDEMSYLDLPDRVRDIHDVPGYARSSYVLDKQSGAWMLSPTAKEFLAQARQEIEQIESETATRLAELREQTTQLEAALQQRTLQASARESLMDAGCERRLLKSAVDFFCATNTATLQPDGAVLVTRADGTALPIEQAAREFLDSDAVGGPFAKRQPARSPAKKSEFLNRLERLSG